jgi:putative isomerase
MDNSPVHDEADYDPATRCLTTIDVGLNALLALDAEMLSSIAAELGDAQAAAQHAAIAERTRALVRTELWDASRGIFANRLPSGAFARSLGPTSFYPLLAGCATEEQIDRMLCHLEDPSMFGGTFVIPSVSRNDPAYADNTYWRGRVWPPLNYLVWHGLRRCGRADLASRLACAGIDLFRQSWTTRRLCPENYNAETGEPLDQPDTEGFYGWGALMPLMGTMEITDFSPWQGWSISNSGADAALHQIETPLGPASVFVEQGCLRLAQGGSTLLSTKLRGSLQNIIWDKSGIAMSIPPFHGSPCEILFPNLNPAEVHHVSIDRHALEFAIAGAGISLTLIPCAAKRRLVIHRGS